jgi:dynein heavy chain, axonemal
MGEDY